MSDARILYRGPFRSAHTLIAELESEGFAVSHGPMDVPKGVDAVHNVIVWAGVGTVDNVGSESLRARIREIIRRSGGAHPHADVSIR